MDNTDDEECEKYSNHKTLTRKSRIKTIWVPFYSKDRMPKPTLCSYISTESEGVNEMEDQVEDNEIDTNEGRVTVDAALGNLPEYHLKEHVKEDPPLEVPFETTDDRVKVIDEILETETSDGTVDPKEELTLINTRALSQHASTYELETFEKNALIIFNQKKFDGHKPRLGTEKDVEALTKTFTQFGFEVFEHKDLTKDDIFKELREFSSRNFTDYGCVAVAVLTHGSNYGLLRARDQQFNEIEIINHFKDCNKPTLVTKPKLIIVQACRGTKISPSVSVHQEYSAKIRKDLDEDLEPYILPVESDMLILHSSYVGSPSHRHEVDGSWFIQELCDKINNLAPEHDLESIMIEVKREVAINRHHIEQNKKTFEMDINKQMPVMTSTLIRKLYLKKFGDKPIDETFTDNSFKKENDPKNEVLDTEAIPSTPLLVQFGPCSCFLDHFTYMKNCLRYFVEDNPEDEIAQTFLELADTFEDAVEFNTAKQKMSKAISRHLLGNARNYHYYKYLYFYKQ